MVTWYPETILQDIYNIYAHIFIFIYIDEQMQGIVVSMEPMVFKLDGCSLRVVHPCHRLRHTCDLMTKRVSDWVTTSLLIFLHRLSWGRISLSVIYFQLHFTPIYHINACIRSKLAHTQTISNMALYVLSKLFKEYYHIIIKFVILHEKLYFFLGG